LIVAPAPQSLLKTFLGVFVLHFAARRLFFRAIRAVEKSRNGL
jgi:hypothetical protein